MLWPCVSTSKSKMAEGVRFELTRPFGLPVFKTGAINRSATPPAVAGGVDTGLRRPAAATTCHRSRAEQAGPVSRLFPIRTIPAEKFFEAIDVAPVKINKILPFVRAHFARIWRRTRFGIS